MILPPRELIKIIPLLILQLQTEHDRPFFRETDLYFVCLNSNKVALRLQIKIRHGLGNLARQPQDTEGKAWLPCQKKKGKKGNFQVDEDLITGMLCITINRSNPESVGQDETKTSTPCAIAEDTWKKKERKKNAGLLHLKETCKKVGVRYRQMYLSIRCCGNKKNIG